MLRSYWLQSIFLTFPNQVNYSDYYVLYNCKHLLVVFLLLVIDGVELQLVLVSLDRDESDPVSELVLLQVLLGQVLQVLTRELSGGNNNNLVALLGDGDGVTQVTDDTVNLNTLVQELNVSLLVEDSVLHWSGGVNDELLWGVSVLGGLESC